MTLDAAKAALEALPGGYDVGILVVEGSVVDFVKFSVRVASPDLLPEETRQGILRIQQTLERALGCVVSFAISAGLRMPDSG